MVLGKMGGLALVPVYTISIKVSTVLVSLGKRNYQSFYPALQKMFIQGERQKFFGKYADVGLLTVSTGLGISGIILCMNRTAVELLAKPEFYAGPVATAWFAVATITMPVCGLLQTPLLVAGKMGKSVIVAVSRAIIAVGLCILAFRQYGIAGLAAVMALLPLVMGTYAFFRCHSLRTLPVPQSLQRVGPGAFEDSPAGESLKLPVRAPKPRWRSESKARISPRRPPISSKPTGVERKPSRQPPSK
jgi:O-antigen/teichoic acid export membrane protein